MARITQAQGRRAFGGDPAAYDQGRPDYPAGLLTHLKRTCGVKPGIRVFEVGPGPGRFTQRFAATRPKALVAIEPDPRLAAYVAGRLKGVRGLEVVNKAFEDAELAEGAFDLGLAATSFHWVDTRVGLGKVFRALKPGGSWSMWWSIYGGTKADDPFVRASDRLFRKIPKTPSHQKGRRQAYGLQHRSRMKELREAGFVGIRYRLLEWKTTLTSDQMVALMQTFSPLLLLPKPRREAFLRELRSIVDVTFGGKVDRRFQTAIYTARKPLRAGRQARN